MEVKRLFVSKKNGKGVSERRQLLTKKKKNGSRIHTNQKGLI
jgi:hypothetical protein